MKELSIKQKAKTYDEALEKAKEWYNDSHITIGLKGNLEDIFPELKESEDEKMMHQLHSWMKEFGGAEEYTEKVYTWLKSLLEKQGEKSVNKLQVSGKLYEHIRNTCACIDDAHSSVTLADINDYLSMAKRSAQSAFDMIEKQGESNPYSGISLDYNGHTWGMCARDNGVDILLDKQLFKHLEKQDKQKVPVVDFKAEDWYVSKVDGKIYNAKFMESSEKQGEQVEINPSEFDLRLNRLLKQFESLPKEELANSLSFYLNVVQNDGTYVEEKQGEQKPTNKVEPKFKIGDWITNDYCAGKVIELTNDAYLLDTRQGIPFSCEHNVHLWTIQDAKDGDVLVASDESLFVFARTKDNAAYYHYSLCKNGSQEISDGKHAWEVAKGCHPATKEQRELLLQKMKESGYEWDAEKKELKKISQRMVSAEAKESLLHDKYEGLTDFERTLADICIGWIGQELGWKQYIKDNADVLLKIAIKMFNSVQDAPFEQKPTDNDMVEALRTEYEKGRADVLRCIDPDEMVADFCSQPLSKTRSLASIYRQGIIDIIKRINRNEETSITSTRSIDDGGVQLPKP